MINVIGCAEVRDLAPELALDVLDGAERAEVLEHTARCASCRALLAELSLTADSVLLLVPEREPSSGFTGRTLAALGVARAGSRHRLRRGMAAAAIVVLVAAGAAVGWVVHDRGSSSARREAGGRAPAGELREASMIGAGGRPAGTAYRYDGARPWLFVSVAYGALPAGSYTVATATGSGPGEQVGTIDVDRRGEGRWGSRAPSADEAVRILGTDGRTLCEARFGRSTPSE